MKIKDVVKVTKGAVKGEMIRKFLDEHSDEIYSIEELLKECHCGIECSTSTKHVRTLVGPDYNFPGLARRRWFGCPAAIKEAKEIMGIGDGILSPEGIQVSDPVLDSHMTT